MIIGSGGLELAGSLIAEAVLELETKTAIACELAFAATLGGRASTTRIAGREVDGRGLLLLVHFQAELGVGLRVRRVIFAAQILPLRMGGTRGHASAKSSDESKGSIHGWI